MMDIFILMFFGGIVGWLVVRPGFNRLWDITMGMLGALASGSLASAFGRPGATGYNAYTFVVAMIGAVLTIYIGRIIADQSKISS